MKKTLYCEIGIREYNFTMPKYKKVTAEKVDEIENGSLNLYRDKEGNEYIVRFNKFYRRNEFVKL